jgi:hypothetical protein
MAQLVATKVNGVVTTSSPAPTPIRSSATCSAEVPLLKPTQCSAPDELRKIFFELRHVGSETERAVVDGAGDGGVQFLADAAELRGQIEVRDRVCFSSLHVGFKKNSDGG